MATKKKAPKKQVNERKLERWKTQGTSLAKAKWANQWAIAKWMCDGEDGFKRSKPYELAAIVTGMTVETLRQFAYTARAIKVSTRVNGLSFGHHRLVAGYTEDVQKRYLKHAKDNKESVASFAAFLKTLRQDAAPETPPAEVAALKVIKACDSFLRNFQKDDFDTLLDEHPSPAARTKVLDRLKDAIVELNEKLEEMEVAWGVKVRGAGAGK